ncbi:Exopolyphosphatase [Pseudoalteromonas holothuriae]|uniref:Exopolyphosphatase n=1 Tax=Pseudoalteromonas holothuriae TaxID=2963714 RepID=A0A9W4QUV4_9GAMM|nr:MULTISPECIES: exopolyphosphatase [unclassified Pseudoalteromonas]CAH9054264.1 Exopolyphosphatase [Pseudoalteromonas sp. CIP111854]CAH9058837.1 Exopolyphosphatase [Pseudoalteromonas sp. CIP111951]
MTEYPPIAAVDLGSNSFHLLVAREVDGRFQVLHKEKQRVNLAAGLSADMVLSNEAIDRALAVLKQFSATLQNFPHSNVQVVATYTLRNCKNIKQFLAKAKQCFPFKINVISGQEEARLIYQGVANYEHSEGNRLVIDIGGGSTELIIGEHFTHKLLTSRNMGCVNITKMFFKEDRLNEKRFTKAQIKAQQLLEPITASYKKLGWQRCYGTSGTIKALSAIAQAHFNTHILTHSILLQIKTLILQAEHCNEFAIEGLSDERKSSICGGIAILIAIFEQLDIRQLFYSDHALRDGLLHETSTNKAFDIRARTIQTLSEHYNVDRQHSEHICHTLTQFYQQISSSWSLKEIDLQMLYWAAKLHEVGLAINSSGLHRHSAYIVSHSQLPGFTQEQQQLLSNLIRFYRKKIRISELKLCSSIELGHFSKLLSLFRLAVLLNAKRQDNLCTEVKLSSYADALLIEFKPNWLNEHSLMVADLNQEQQHLKKLNLTLVFS